MNTLALTLLLVSSLFDRMSGEWTAQGIRHQNFSGRDTALVSQTSSEVRGGALISSSRTVETDARSGERIREYELSYWMRPVADSEVSGEFVLGPGVDSSGPSRASAHFDGSTLRTTQSLGGDFEIRSETVFGEDPDLILYRETTFRGDTVLSETQLQYRRKK